MLTLAVPAGATNISFTLDSFGTDDKGVVQLNGTNIADAVIFVASGAAAGAGTFDFGLGGGNQAYTYVGFTPGTAFPIANGTTTVTIVVRMNDTGTGDPSAPPLAQANTTSFSIGGTLTYTEAIVASTTTVQSSVNPSTAGQAVTFTATVTGNSPTGTVQFFDGANPLGGPVTLVGGVATLTTSALAGGSHVITATYSGDANNTTSTSSPLTQSVIVISQAAAIQIPTLSEIMLALLAAFLGVLGAVRFLRQR
jgi:hypothetical protein